MRHKKINFIGPISAKNGLAQAARSHIRAIKQLNIDTTIFDTYNLSNNNKLASFLRGVKNTDINIWFTNIDIIQQFSYFIQNTPGYNIAEWYWERTDIPSRFKFANKGLNEIWTGSNFCAEIFRNNFKTPIEIIPPVIDFSDQIQDRTIFNIPNQKFLFLFMYDSKSTRIRKNPDDILKAYLKAFPYNDNVGLVIKVNNSSAEEIMSLKRSSNKNVHFITERLSRKKNLILINSCDCLVSLHKSEGFGMTLAEAMLLGKPVIGTNWSGNTYFMKMDNSCLVDYTLQRNKKSQGQYDKGCLWAFPNIDNAAYYMQKIYSDSLYREEIAKNGKEFISTNLSTSKIQSLIRKRLNSISFNVFSKKKNKKRKKQVIKNIVRRKRNG